MQFNPVIFNPYSFGSYYQSYAKYKTPETSLDLSKLKKLFDDLLLTKNLSDSMAILITGSDGRGEANPQIARFELIIVYDPSANLKFLKEQVKKLCSNYEHKIDQNIEWRPKDDSKLFGYYEHGDKQLSFPTRCLDARYLSGSKALAECYKTRFLEQLRGDEGRRLLRQFKKESLKDSLRQLKKILSPNSGVQRNLESSISQLKHAALRSIQYYVALKLLMDFAHNKDFSIQDLEQKRASTEERLKFLEDMELLGRYKTLLVTYHYYALASERSLSIEVTQDLLQTFNEIYTYVSSKLEKIKI
tara:strand:+ start:1386 stop:2294 length:909 start_codon:yes stop_codon:yes gene_type:complete